MGVQVIGAAGCGPSVGTTHFALLTAAWLSGVLRKRTAVLERNESGDFLRFARVLGGEVKKFPKTVTNATCRSFTLWETDYYAGAGRETLAELAGEGYDAVVMDFGAYGERMRDEMLLCGRRFLVCSGREWQLQRLADMLGDRAAAKIGWEYVLFFGGGEPVEILERSFGIRIRQIPETDSPFCITGELLSFFGKFLNETGTGVNILQRTFLW